MSPLPIFFDLLLCLLVWKVRYSVSVMQLVFVDIHEMCCLFLYCHLHLLLPFPSPHCVSLLLIPTSLYRQSFYSLHLHIRNLHVSGSAQSV